MELDLDRCRMCAGISDPGVSLLDPTKQRLANWIRNNLKTDISPTNGYPVNICINCICSIQEWVRFKTRCNSSNRYFLQQLVKREEEESNNENQQQQHLQAVTVSIERLSPDVVMAANEAPRKNALKIKPCPKSKKNDTPITLRSTSTDSESVSIERPDVLVVENEVPTESALKVKPCPKSKKSDAPMTLRSTSTDSASIERPDVLVVENEAPREDVFKVKPCPKSKKNDTPITLRSTSTDSASVSIEKLSPDVLMTANENMVRNKPCPKSKRNVVNSANHDTSSALSSGQVPHLMVARSGERVQNKPCPKSKRNAGNSANHDSASVENMPSETIFRPMVACNEKSLQNKPCPKSKMISEKSFTTSHQPVNNDSVNVCNKDVPIDDISHPMVPSYGGTTMQKKPCTRSNKNSTDTSLTSMKEESHWTDTRSNVTPKNKPCPNEVALSSINKKTVQICIDKLSPNDLLVASSNHTVQNKPCTQSSSENDGDMTSTNQGPITDLVSKLKSTLSSNRILKVKPCPPVSNKEKKVKQRKSKINSTETKVLEIEKTLEEMDRLNSAQYCLVSTDETNTSSSSEVIHGEINSEEEPNNQTESIPVVVEENSSLDQNTSVPETQVETTEVPEILESPIVPVSSEPLQNTSEIFQTPARASSKKLRSTSKTSVISSASTKVTKQRTSSRLLRKTSTPKTQAISSIIATPETSLRVTRRTARVQIENENCATNEMSPKVPEMISTEPTTVPEPSKTPTMPSESSTVEQTPNQVPVPNLPFPMPEGLPKNQPFAVVPIVEGDKISYIISPLPNMFPIPGTETVPQHQSATVVPPQEKQRQTETQESCDDNDDDISSIHEEDQNVQTEENVSQDKRCESVELIPNQEVISQERETPQPDIESPPDPVEVDLVDSDVEVPTLQKSRVSLHPFSDFSDSDNEVAQCSTSASPDHSPDHSESDNEVVLPQVNGPADLSDLTPQAMRHLGLTFEGYIPPKGTKIKSPSKKTIPSKSSQNKSSVKKSTRCVSETPVATKKLIVIGNSPIEITNNSIEVVNVTTKASTSIVNTNTVATNKSSNVTTRVGTATKTVAAKASTPIVNTNTPIVTNIVTESQNVVTLDERVETPPPIRKSSRKAAKNALAKISFVVNTGYSDDEEEDPDDPDCVVSSEESDEDELNRHEKRQSGQHSVQQLNPVQQLNTQQQNVQSTITQQGQTVQPETNNEMNQTSQHETQNVSSDRVEDGLVQALNKIFYPQSENQQPVKSNLPAIQENSNKSINLSPCKLPEDLASFVLDHELGTTTRILEENSQVVKKLCFDTTPMILENRPSTSSGISENVSENTSKSQLNSEKTSEFQSQSSSTLTNILQIETTVNLEKNAKIVKDIPLVNLDPDIENSNITIEDLNLDLFDEKQKKKTTSKIINLDESLDEEGLLNFSSQRSLPVRVDPNLPEFPETNPENLIKSSNSLDDEALLNFSLPQDFPERSEPDTPDLDSTYNFNDDTKDSSDTDWNTDQEHIIPKPNLICSICDKMFINNKSFVNHYAQHSYAAVHVKTLKMRKNKKMKKKRDLKKKQQKTKQRKMKQSTTTTTMLSCDLCQKIYKKKRFLERHIRNHLNLPLKPRRLKIDLPGTRVTRSTDIVFKSRYEKKYVNNKIFKQNSLAKKIAKSHQKNRRSSMRRSSSRLQFKLLRTTENDLNKNETSQDLSETLQNLPEENIQNLDNTTENVAEVQNEIVTPNNERNTQDKNDQKSSTKQDGSEVLNDQCLTDEGKNPNENRTDQNMINASEVPDEIVAPNIERNTQNEDKTDQKSSTKEDGPEILIEKAQCLTQGDKTDQNMTDASEIRDKIVAPNIERNTQNEDKTDQLSSTNQDGLEIENDQCLTDQEINQNLNKTDQNMTDASEVQDEIVASNNERNTQNEDKTCQLSLTNQDGSEVLIEKDQCLTEKDKTDQNMIPESSNNNQPLSKTLNANSDQIHVEEISQNEDKMVENMTEDKNKQLESTEQLAEENSENMTEFSGDSKPLSETFNENSGQINEEEISKNVSEVVKNVTEDSTNKNSEDNQEEISQNSNKPVDNVYATTSKQIDTNLSETEISSAVVKKVTKKTQKIKTPRKMNLRLKPSSSEETISCSVCQVKLTETQIDSHICIKLRNRTQRTPKNSETKTQQKITKSKDVLESTIEKNIEIDKPGLKRKYIKRSLKNDAPQKQESSDNTSFETPKKNPRKSVKRNVTPDILLKNEPKIKITPKKQESVEKTSHETPKKTPRKSAKTIFSPDILQKNEPKMKLTPKKQENHGKTSHDTPKNTPRKTAKTIFSPDILQKNEPKMKLTPKKQESVEKPSHETPKNTPRKYVRKIPSQDTPQKNESKIKQTPKKQETPKKSPTKTSETKLNQNTSPQKNKLKQTPTQSEKRKRGKTENLDLAPAKKVFKVATPKKSELRGKKTVTPTKKVTKKRKFDESFVFCSTCNQNIPTSEHAEHPCMAKLLKTNERAAKKLKK